MTSKDIALKYIEKLKKYEDKGSNYKTQEGYYLYMFVRNLRIEFEWDFKEILEDANAI